jgi:tripartite-type tricarboxylate transporter receptor subunit TctC
MEGLRLRQSKRYLFSLFFILVLAAFALSACSASAPAADSNASAGQNTQTDYPNKTINLIVAFTAGGGTDILARVYAEPLGKILGRSVIVVNQPGAGGITSFKEFVRLAPDGYNVTFSAGTTYQAELLDDTAPKKDSIKAVANLNFDPIVLIVPKNSPYKTLEEFIAAAQENPNTLSLAHGGVGTAYHMMSLQWEQVADMRLKFVAYNGAGECLTAVAGGQVDVCATTFTEAKGQIEGGNVIPLAVAMEERDPNFPDVPTWKELGYDYVNGVYRYIAVPDGTPDEIVQILADATKQAMESDEMQAYFNETLMGALYLDPAQTQQMWDDCYELAKEAYEYQKTKEQ